jgi:hypothetical protein
MDKETIFKEIRRQQVLLWAGAGLSRYAGYPMGKGVVERLYQELSGTQKQQLAITLSQKQPECPSLMPLPDFAQYFVNLHYDNRQRLVEILDTIFSTLPTSRSIHDKLASIAFIDKIVTTNYDSLFELAYGYHNLHIVTQATNVPQGSSKDTTLYKIHGELRNPESLIITKDDYYGFFQRADDVVWTQLRALMAVRTIVFIGYAVEDPNVLDVFLDTLSKLGKLMRPAYVIGPDMPQLRVEELRRKNIHFIQATGEEFVDDLLADIKLNAISDLKVRGAALVKPVSKTLSNMGLNCNMSIDGETYLVNNIESKKGPTNETIKFTAFSPETKSEVNNLLKGLSLAPVKIKLDSFNKFHRIIEGFVLPEDSNDEIWLMRKPEWRSIVDVKFASGLYIKDVSLNIFKSPSYFHIVALSENARLEVIFSRIKAGNINAIELQYTKRRPWFSDLSDAIEYAKIMHELGTALPFEIIQRGQSIWKSQEHGKRKIDKNNTFVREAQAFTKLLDMLVAIEVKLGISFRRFSLDGQSVNDIINIYYILTQQPFYVSLKGPIEVMISEETTEAINNCIRNKEGIVFKGDNEDEYEVLGWRIKIIWKEEATIEKPNIKRKTSAFLVKSTDKRKGIERHCVSVMKTEIVSKPVWPADISLTKDQLLTEQQPSFKA